MSDLERAIKWNKNNPERRKIIVRRYYNNHLVQYKQRYEEKKKWINDYKLFKGCAICGYNKCAGALKFHHNGNKEFVIGRGYYKYNWEKVEKEIEKCIILCANCHEELHFKLQVNYKEVI